MEIEIRSDRFTHTDRKIHVMSTHFHPVVQTNTTSRFQYRDGLFDLFRVGTYVPYRDLDHPVPLGSYDHKRRRVFRIPPVPWMLVHNRYKS